MTDKQRRKFITVAAATTVAVPVSAVIGSLPSYAADAPMVDEASDAAKNWEYIAMSDKEGNSCANCALYQGAEGSEAGGCPLFPGSNVAAAGWCKAYAPKPS